MKIIRGSKARNFIVYDIYGRKIHLEEFKGKKVLLSFFRNTVCPFCNLKIYQLNRIKNELNAGNLEMIFVFDSNEQVIRNSSLHNGLSPIYLVSDVEKDLYHLYGVEESFLKVMSSMLGKNFNFYMKEAKRLGLDLKSKEEKNTLVIPADFLIDEHQVIHTAYYGKTMQDSLSMEKIREFI